MTLPNFHKGTLFVPYFGHKTYTQMHYQTIIKEISKKKDQNENDVFQVVVIFKTKDCLLKATISIISPDLDFQTELM